MNLTPRQLHIVQLIRDSRVARGYSPTIQELADEIGVAKVTVHEHVGALVKKGVLQKEPNKARSLSLVEGLPLPNEDNGVRFPLIGRIAAGLPIEQFEQSDTLDLESVFGPRVGEVGSTFALQVTGDSMQDEGILDGDYVIVRRASTARAGERVVALLPNGETTLKSFYREPDGRIRLQPANDAFEPILCDEDQVEIRGVVVSLLRKY